MNVLYLTCCRLHPTQGGTERTTITIAKALKHQYGSKIYSIYEQPTDAEMETCLDSEFLWKPQKKRSANVAFLRNIVIGNNIDAVIIQGAFIHVKMMREAIAGLSCKILFAHHFRPGFELTFHNFKDVLKRKHSGIADTMRWIRDIVLYRKLHKAYINTIRKSYHEAYEHSDSVVLLSRNFVKSYMEIGSFNDESKFIIIPNALSFGDILSPDKLTDKKNIALIVARLDEPPKKISTALKIWSIVKKQDIAHSWILNIVGHGPHKTMYEQMVKQYNIPDVHFLGRQDPLPYYREASVFMMTSSSESWGLTITEAQQMGVVPIAFNTYESLQDIITDGVDGCIVAPGNISDYADTMLELMSDTNKRQTMAKAGLQSCRRFSSDKIAAMWRNFLI